MQEKLENYIAQDTLSKEGEIQGWVPGDTWVQCGTLQKVKQSTFTTITTSENV